MHSHGRSSLLPHFEAGSWQDNLVSKAPLCLPTSCNLPKPNSQRACQQLQATTGNMATMQHRINSPLPVRIVMDP